MPQTGSSKPKTKMAVTFMTCSSYTFMWQNSDTNSWNSAYSVKKARLVRTVCG